MAAITNCQRRMPGSFHERHPQETMSGQGGPMAITYKAKAVREGRYWIVTADPEGLHLAGQVRRLDNAVPVMRSIVAALDVPEESVIVDLDVQ